MTERVRCGGTIHELVAPRTIRPAQRPLPTPGPGEVALRPTAVGVCGTDLHTWRGRTDRLPIVPTHDGVADVVTTGPGVAADLLGARVVIDPVDACGDCGSCRNHHFGVCLDGGYLGMTVDGLLADQIVLPANRVVVLPDSVSDIAATVLEPVAIGVRIARHARRAAPPGRALIVGGGPLGILIAQVLRVTGWQPQLIEPRGDRQTLAASLGIPASEPSDRWRGSSALVVEASAAAAGAALAANAVQPGGLLVLLGRSPAAVPASDVLLKELCVLGIRGASGYYPEAITMAARGVVQPAAVVTHKFNRDQIEEAFAADEHDAAPVRSVIWMHSSPTP